MLFEVSWEVCNKVGGINTVISSKASILKKKSEEYYCIGPYFNQSKSVFKPKTIPSKFSKGIKGLEEKGIKVYYGEWNIHGKPNVFLIDFKSLFGELNFFKTEYWNYYKVDSIHTNYGFEEPLIFSTAAGMLIESLTKKAVVHSHEWMTGFTNLYLKMKNKDYRTVFTAHATVLGRSISGSGEDVYQYNINADEKAKSLGIIDKHTAEKASANYSDVFTTVSEVTSKECEYYLSKKPDFVIPNGLDMKRMPKVNYLKYKAKVNSFVQKMYPEVKKAKYFFTSGRYEYRSKGWDLILDSLKQIRNENAVFFFLIAIPNNGFKERLNEENPLITHYMHDNFMEEEIKKRGFTKEDKLKIIVYPSYIDEKDDLLKLNYDEFVQGMDLGVFPSYYEPYGYTPLETSVYGIPSVTSVYSGFGDYVKEEAGNGLFIVKDENELTEVFKKIIREDKKEYRDNVKEIAKKKGDWNNIIKLYYEAYGKGF